VKKEISTQFRSCKTNHANTKAGPNPPQGGHVYVGMAEVDSRLGTSLSGLKDWNCVSVKYRCGRLSVLKQSAGSKERGGCG